MAYSIGKNKENGKENLGYGGTARRTKNYNTDALNGGSQRITLSDSRKTQRSDVEPIQAPGGY